LTLPRKLMATPKFMNSLTSLNIDGLEQSKIDKLKKFIEEEGVDANKLKGSSVPASYLAQYLRSVMNYFDTKSGEVTLDKSTAMFQDMERKIEEKKEEIIKLDDKLKAKSVDRLKEAAKEKEKMEKMEKMEKEKMEKMEKEKMEKMEKTEKKERKLSGKFKKDQELKIEGHKAEIIRLEAPIEKMEAKENIAPEIKKEAEIKKDAEVKEEKIKEPEVKEAKEAGKQQKKSVFQQRADRNRKPVMEKKELSNLASAQIANP